MWMRWMMSPPSNSCIAMFATSHTIHTKSTSRNLIIWTILPRTKIPNLTITLNSSAKGSKYKEKRKLLTTRAPFMASNHKHFSRHQQILSISKNSKIWAISALCSTDNTKTRLRIKYKRNHRKKEKVYLTFLKCEVN